MSVRLLAFAASHRPASLNRQLVARAAEHARSLGAEVTLAAYEQFDAPLYRGETNTALPAGVAHLSALLREHDGLMLAMPEYNWSIPGPLKNLIDWLSIEPTNPFAGRTGLLMSASPSARGGVSGLQQLRVPLEVLGLWVYPQVIGIGQAETQENEFEMREKDRDHLHQCIADFSAATRALRSYAHP